MGHAQCFRHGLGVCTASVSSIFGFGLDDLAHAQIIKRAAGYEVAHCTPLHDDCVALFDANSGWCGSHLVCRSSMGTSGACCGG